MLRRIIDNSPGPYWIVIFDHIVVGIVVVVTVNRIHHSTVVEEDERSASPTRVELTPKGDRVDRITSRAARDAVHRGAVARIYSSIDLNRQTAQTVPIREQRVTTIKVRVLLTAGIKRFVITLIIADSSPYEVFETIVSSVPMPRRTKPAAVKNTRLGPTCPALITVVNEAGLLETITSPNVASSNDANERLMQGGPVVVGLA